MQEQSKPKAKSRFY